MQSSNIATAVAGITGKITTYLPATLTAVLAVDLFGCPAELEGIRALGLPAVTLNWGPWSEVGAAVSHGVSERMSAQGIGTILQARHLLLIVTGDAKAGAVAAAVEGPVSASCRGAPC